MHDQRRIWSATRLSASLHNPGVFGFFSKSGVSPGWVGFLRGSSRDLSRGPAPTLLILKHTEGFKYHVWTKFYEIICLNCVNIGHKIKE